MPLIGVVSDVTDIRRFLETSTTMSDGVDCKTAASWFSVRKLRDRSSEFKLVSEDRAPASRSSILLSARSSTCKFAAAARECRLISVSKLSPRYSSVRAGSDAEELRTNVVIQLPLKSSSLNAVRPTKVMPGDVSFLIGLRARFSFCRDLQLANVLFLKLDK